MSRKLDEKYANLINRNVPRRGVLRFDDDSDIPAERISYVNK